MFSMASMIQPSARPSFPVLEGGFAIFSGKAGWGTWRNRRKTMLKNIGTPRSRRSVGAAREGAFRHCHTRKLTMNPGLVIDIRIEVACFRKTDSSFTQKICRDLAAHRISAQKAGQHGKRAIGGYPEKPSENRGQKPGQHPRRICTDEEIRDDQKGRSVGRTVRNQRSRPFSAPLNTVCGKRRSSRKNRRVDKVYKSRFIFSILL